MWMQSIEDSQGGGIPMIGGQGIAERYGIRCQYILSDSQKGI